MAFELIQLADVIETPAIEAKQFPIGWLETFHARVVSPTEGEAFYELKPMAMDGSKHPAQVVQRRIPNIWEAAKAVPAIGAAVEALVAAVKDYEAYIAQLPKE